MSEDFGLVKKKREEEDSKRREQYQDNTPTTRQHPHNKNSDSGLSIKMFEAAKELIKMDLTTEEGIGKAINLLHSPKFSNPELEPKVMEVASQAQLVQRFMDKAKDGQNKLRSSIVELLIPSRL